MTILAIDIGGTKIAFGLIESGQLLERRQCPTPKVESLEQFCDYLLLHCKDWSEQASKIGISTTGLVTEQGISAINPDTFNFPTPFPLQQALEFITGKPVAMLNDAQAAAWYEYVQLGESGKSIAYLTVSTGVGGGIIIDGKLHKGSHNFAGHIGHTVVDLNGPECGCGQCGCVEALASGTAIARRAHAEIDPSISNITLFAMAKTDPAARAIINQSVTAISALCCNLKASLDLDLIILGGGVGLADNYLNLVQQQVAKAPKVFQLPIIAAQGDYDACLLGAAFQFSE
ncbi:N-acetylmannosamine kinase [Vibrio sp.]|uniref:N-acetylmannosamine kinase n=1 Tax=Vibrio sp. TaxID=678 RepID=UPI003D0C95BC